MHQRDKIYAVDYIFALQIKIQKPTKIDCINNILEYQSKLASFKIWP